MSAPLIIGGVVLGGGLYLWWKSKQQKAPSDCYMACDAQAKLTGVPAFLCKAGCDFLGEHPFTCPPGYSKASDSRSGTVNPNTRAAGTGIGSSIGSGVGGATLTDLSHTAIENGGYTIQGVTSTCVKTPDPNAPLPVVVGTGTQTSFGCSNLPANVTWDPATSSWRRMAAGETRNLGPCGPSSGVGTVAVMHALPIGSTL